MPEQKRKPGRPPKSMGLAPLQKATNGDQLREMRRPPVEPQEPVLSPPREGNAPQDGVLGVFGTAGVVNGGRGESTSQQPAVPVDSRPDVEEPLASIFKRLLQEVAATEFQESGSQMRNAEVLARKIMQRALNENQFAIELVLDRAEGKAVRGTPVVQTDTAIEDQIDRASVAQLNSLVEKES